jgi:hypothetical protein
MSNGSTPSSLPTAGGAAAACNHLAWHGQHATGDVWLKQVGPHCRAQAGHIDWQIIRLIAALTSTSTVNIRFNSLVHLIQRWHFG